MICRWITAPSPAGLLVHLTIWGALTAAGVVLASDTPEPAPMDVEAVSGALIRWARLAPRHPVHRAKYRAEVATAIHAGATRHGLPVEVVTAIVLRESSARPGVVGPAGELGLMQVHPLTAVRYRCRMVTPDEQIDCGCRILSRHLTRCGTVRGALAAHGSRSGSCTPPAGGSVARMVADRLALSRKIRRGE